MGNMKGVRFEVRTSTFPNMQDTRRVLRKYEKRRERDAETTLHMF